MSFKTKVIVLGAIFAALLSALIIGGLISPQGVNQRAAAQLLLSGFRAGDAASIEASDSSQRLLMRKSTTWSIEVSGRQFPASAEHIAAFLNAIAALPRGASRRARVVLMSLSKPDAATNTNAGLLAEFFDARRIFELPWLGKRPDTGKVLRDLRIRHVLQALVK